MFTNSTFFLFISMRISTSSFIHFPFTSFFFLMIRRPPRSTLFPLHDALPISETLALNANSRVRVADVFVGRVRAIGLKNWIATLTLDLEKGVKLPKNATAKIGQTSLLGSQHVELASPANPSPQLLKNGDIIPLQNASAYPTTERVLASFAAVLRGGGIPNVEVIASEVRNMLTGRADQIHDFLKKLDTFTARLNEQRDDITRAI